MTRTAANAEASLAAIVLAVATYASLSGVHAMMKLLAGVLDPLMIVWVRHTGQVLIVFVLFAPFRGLALFRTERPRLNLVRGVLFLAVTLFNVLAFQALQMAQAISIIFAAPFLTVIFARLILKERVGPRRWTAVLIGFVGVVIVAQPKADGLDLGAFWALASAVCTATFNLCTRLLAAQTPSAKHEDLGAALMLASLVPMLGLTPALPILWTTPTSLDAWLLIAGIGIVGAAGQACLTFAFRYAPASALAPWHYTQIVSSAGLGFFIFAEVPTHTTWIGVAVVALGGLMALPASPKAAPDPMWAQPTIARIALAAAFSVLAILAPAPTRLTPQARVQAKLNRAPPRPKASR